MKRLVKIGIAEDHDLFRKGIVSIINGIENHRVVCEAGNGKELLEQIPKAKPDLVILDIEMPEMNGEQTLKKIREKFSSVRVIMLSMYYEDAFISKFIGLGANGFLPKNCSLEKFEDAIFSVLETGYYFDEKINRILLYSMAKTNKLKRYKEGVTTLSPIEVQVLQLICEEKSVKQIAEELCLSPRTIEGHRSRLYEKTKARNLIGLAIYAIKNNLFDPSFA